MCAAPRRARGDCSSEAAAGRTCTTVAARGGGRPPAPVTGSAVQKRRGRRCPAGGLRALRPQPTILWCSAGARPRGEATAGRRVACPTGGERKREADCGWRRMGARGPPMGQVHRLKSGTPANRHIGRRPGRGLLPFSLLSRQLFANGQDSGSIHVPVHGSGSRDSYTCQASLGLNLLRSKP